MNDMTMFSCESEGLTCKVLHMYFSQVFISKDVYDGRLVVFFV